MVLEPGNTGGVGTFMADVAMRDTPEHWRERARQARADASLHADPEIKKTMLEIAATAVVANGVKHSGDR